LNLSQNTTPPSTLKSHVALRRRQQFRLTSRYAGGSNFVSLDFVSDALPLPESEQR
jgi:hypothetical protein